MDKLLQTGLIFRVKTVKEGTIDIQNTPNFALYANGDHDFGIGSAIAGNMAGELMHIRYALGAILCHGSAADTTAYGNDNAGRLFIYRLRRDRGWNAFTV